MTATLRDRRRNGTKLLLVVAGLSCGCTPGVRFLRVGVQGLPPAEQPEGLAFHSSFEVTGMSGEQLVYQVNLLDRQGKPIKSRNARFEDEAGNVAARKTLMVYDAISRFDNIAVNIPARELEFRPEDLPLGARFGVYHPDGTRIAAVRVSLAIPSSTLVGLYRSTNTAPLQKPDVEPEEDPGFSKDADKTQTSEQVGPSRW